MPLKDAGDEKYILEPPVSKLSLNVIGYPSDSLKKSFKKFLIASPVLIPLSVLFKSSTFLSSI